MTLNPNALSAQEESTRLLLRQLAHLAQLGGTLTMKLKTVLSMILFPRANFARVEAIIILSLSRFHAHHALPDVSNLLMQTRRLQTAIVLVPACSAQRENTSKMMLTSQAFTTLWMHASTAHEIQFQRSTVPSLVRTVRSRHSLKLDRHRATPVLRVTCVTVTEIKRHATLESTAAEQKRLVLIALSVITAQPNLTKLSALPAHISRWLASHCAKFVKRVHTQVAAPRLSATYAMQVFISIIHK